MDFDYSPKTKELQAKLLQFMDEHIYPAEADYTAELQANTAAGKRWSALNTIENLKPKAQAAGLWNLFLPVDSAAASGYAGAGLTNQEYAPLAEIMGRVPWASEVFNCSAPDTGNMETIARYGSEENKTRWLKPLLEGDADLQPVAQGVGINFVGRRRRPEGHRRARRAAWAHPRRARCRGRGRPAGRG